MLGFDKLIMLALYDRDGHMDIGHIARRIVGLRLHHLADRGGKCLELVRRGRQLGIVLGVPAETPGENRNHGLRDFPYTAGIPGCVLYLVIRPPVRSEPGPSSLSLSRPSTSLETIFGHQPSDRTSKGALSRNIDVMGHVTDVMLARCDPVRLRIALTKPFPHALSRPLTEVLLTRCTNSHL